MNQEDQLIALLEKFEVVDSRSLPTNSADLHGILLKLQSLEQITFEQHESSQYIPTLEGEEVIKQGSKEFLFYQSIPNNSPISIAKNNPIGLSYAKKLNYIEIKDKIIIKNTVIKDITQQQLINQEYSSELQKRNLIKPIKIIYYSIKKGPKFLIRTDSITKILSHMVINPNNLALKDYNFNTTGSYFRKGSLHPLLKMRTEIKSIFLQMGFTEMKTNQFIESAFWNFDSLYQPQNHPSRDLHDTFYISDCIFISETEFDFSEKQQIIELARNNIKELIYYKNNEKYEIKVLKIFSKEIIANRNIQLIFKNKEFIDEEYFRRVKEVHETGLFGSTGYKYKFNVEETNKLVLRTHTTAVSSKYLYNKNRSTKLFSIDKVFRNETQDSTHLCEFHQVEGVIRGPNLGLSDLIGTITLFFNKLGIKQLKFKPAFNPYTEPSAEVFGFHPLLNKWIEIGNSGIFRPEMVETMGYTNERVLGFGLSLERPAMIKYNCANIRELMGSKLDFDFVEREGVCMVDLGD